MERLLAVSTFRHAKDNRPNNGALPFHALCNRLRNFRESESKDGLLWSPTRYHPNATRGLGNVTAVSCLVADIDSGAEPDRLEPIYQRWSFCVHSTFSHKPEHFKFRLILPLAEDIPQADYSEAWSRFAFLLAHCKVKIDRVCKDPSRIFYTPSCPPDSQRFFFYADWLPFVTVDELPQVFRQERPIAAPRLKDTIPVDAKSIIDHYLRRLVIGNRHDMNVQLAAQLRDNRVPLGDALDVGRQFCAVCPGNYPIEEYERVTNDVYKYPARQPTPSRRRDSVLVPKELLR